MSQKPERSLSLLDRPGSLPPNSSAPRLRYHRISCALLAACACAAASLAQTPLDFRTGDGSRVVLVPIGGPPLVHWAVATPCGPQVDPPSAPGMAAAAARASLRGTWTTGSLDAQKERIALDAFDAAATDLLIAPRVDGKPPADLQQKVAALRDEVAALSDPLAFRRVMMALPTQDLELSIADDVAVLELTTTPFAVPAVARMLRERREDQPLRDVRAELQRLQAEATAAWDEAPLSPLYAEVLALAFPGHPLARSGDRPAAAAFQRALATATWARSQHPTRCVHVLIGNFDPAAVQTALLRAFADTALPSVDSLVPPLPRAQATLRRSQVPGARYPAAVLAFAIPPDADPLVAATAASWLADGQGSWLHGELVRQGRKNVQVAVRAPWPAAAGNGLLVSEVSDPSGGTPALADEVLALCRTKDKQARPGELPAALGTQLRAFEQHTRRPVDQAALFAARLLRSPTTAFGQLQPHNLSFPDVLPLLQRILDGNPIVIEWRDS